MKKKLLYPGIKEVEKEKEKQHRNYLDEQPDFIGNAPNYDKYPHMTPEQVLRMLNVD